MRNALYICIGVLVSALAFSSCDDKTSGRIMTSASLLGICKSRFQRMRRWKSVFIWTVKGIMGRRSMI